MPTILEFAVREKRQFTSGFDHVVRYDAVVKIVPGDGVTVIVENTIPTDADPTLVETARQAIQSGFDQVLGPHGYGATAHLRDLVIHDVDFLASKFEEYSARDLQNAMSASR